VRAISEGRFRADDIGMNGHRRKLLAALSCLCLTLVLPVAAGAAEIVDRNVGAPTLQVDSHNVALVSYTVKGAQRHVLYWGAVDWADAFKRDYSGGWKSKVADYKRFSNSCGHYTGQLLPYMIAACDAPDGSHWALQQWGRLWSNYGGNRAANELYIAHWRGQPAKLAIQTDYSYHGKHEHLWGLFMFHGKPVYGLHSTLQGVPLDKQGRNIYVDYLAGSDWRRVNSFLTHSPTAGFCYTFADHPASDPAWNGRGTGPAYRATAIGPGVSPVVQQHFAPPGPYDEATDSGANQAQQEVLKGDRRCRVD
jgi:hypothetical protein